MYIPIPRRRKIITLFCPSGEMNNPAEIMRIKKDTVMHPVGGGKDRTEKCRQKQKEKQPAYFF